MLPTNVLLRLLCNSLPGLCRVSDFTSGFIAAVLKVTGKRPCLKLLSTVATSLHVQAVCR